MADEKGLPRNSVFIPVLLLTVLLLMLLFGAKPLFEKQEEDEAFDPWLPVECVEWAGEEAGAPWG